MDILEEFLRVIGTGTVGGIVAFLLIFYFKDVLARQFNHVLNKDLEIFKGKLSKEISIENFINQNNFIKKVDLSEKLSKILFNLSLLLQLSFQSKPFDNSKITEFSIDLKNLYDLIGLSLIYFDSDTFDRISDLFILLSKVEYELKQCLPYSASSKLSADKEFLNSINEIILPEVVLVSDLLKQSLNKISSTDSHQTKPLHVNN